MMEDESDITPTELEESDSDDDGPFIDDDGVYIDRLRGFRMLDTQRMVSVSGANIQIELLENETLNCANILQHCTRQVDVVRAAYGGGVSIFKIGVTANPVYRFEHYTDENFDSMTLIHISDCYHLIYMLEAALIQSHNHISGCRNINLGGDGPMHLRPPPYFAYVVGARADGRLRIGG